MMQNFLQQLLIHASLIINEEAEQSSLQEPLSLNPKTEELPAISSVSSFDTLVFKNTRATYYKNLDRVIVGGCVPIILQKNERVVVKKPQGRVWRSLEENTVVMPENLIRVRMEREILKSFDKHQFLHYEGNRLLSLNPFTVKIDKLDTEGTLLNSGAIGFDQNVSATTTSKVECKMAVLEKASKHFTLSLGSVVKLNIKTIDFPDGETLITTDERINVERRESETRALIEIESHHRAKYIELPMDDEIISLIDEEDLDLPEEIQKLEKTLDLLNLKADDKFIIMDSLDEDTVTEDEESDGGDNQNEIKEVISKISETQSNDITTKPLEITPGDQQEDYNESDIESTVSGSFSQIDADAEESVTGDSDFVDDKATERSNKLLEEQMAIKAAAEREREMEKLTKSAKTEIKAKLRRPKILVKRTVPIVEDTQQRAISTTKKDDVCKKSTTENVVLYLLIFLAIGFLAVLIGVAYAYKLKRRANTFIERKNILT